MCTEQHTWVPFREVGVVYAHTNVTESALHLLEGVVRLLTTPPYVSAVTEMSLMRRMVMVLLAWHGDDGNRKVHAKVCQCANRYVFVNI